MRKVLVGLSGGVDSAVAALLLKQQGYEVSAAYIKTWANEYDLFGECPSAEDIRYASGVAETLEIPFEVVNLVESYREKVVQYLVEGYESGITPNPDIMCNREIKFGAFLDWALTEGFDGVATGHYCRRVIGTDGLPAIAEGIDNNKDQSYFLAMLKADQLQHALFPIGDLTKPAVRKLALEMKLPNAERKDSQGICFLGKVRINDFLQQYIPDRPGPIINTQGVTLGEHRGLHRYTIGQRKGIGIPSNHDNKAYVVVSKELSNNVLRVAFDETGLPGLYCDWVGVHSLSCISRPFWVGEVQECRVRYRDPRTSIRSFSHCPDGTYRVDFAETQRALASGQVLAFYEGENLLGGGFMV